MNSFEFELWIEQYKAIIKKTGERALFPDEIEMLDTYVEEYIPEEYREAYNSAKAHDYSRFEKLPHLLRNYLGAKALKDFRDKFGDTPSLDDKDVREYLEKNAMNAALRAGISAEKNAIPHRGDSTKIITEKDAEKTREYAKTLDSYMNGILMKRTMLPPTEEARSRILEQLNTEEQTDAAIERNKAKQLVMAKTMFLAQLGKYDVISKNGLSSELEVPVYETLVHGNRTTFVLPLGEDSQSVLDSFMGERGGAAGIEKRTAATHSVKRRSIDKNGIPSSEGKEERTYSPFKVFSHQYGMDIAAGGLGEVGPNNNQVILGTGDSGHMYMRAQAGDSKHCGSLLIGIEGSAPGSNSFLGNEHGITAKSAKQSAFLADKSIAGKKVGGRQVDLSGLSAQELTSILNTFSQKYTELQNSANTTEGRQKLAEVNDMLMGKPMETKKLIEMFNKLGINGEEVTNTVNKARTGYYHSKIDVSQISREEYQQLIRKRFSTDEACKLAEARFERAGDDLTLAVGAITELMYTHAARPWNYFLRHPFKNYKEKSTISDLLKKLENNGVSRSKIAGEFMRDNDSFAFDWGEGLTHDSREIDFIAEKSIGRVGTKFKSSDDKLKNIRVDVCKKYYKDISVLKANEAYEQEQMQKEFEKFLPDDAQRTKLETEGKIAVVQREKIPVIDANDSIDSIDSSEYIDEKAPQKNNIYKHQ